MPSRVYVYGTLRKGASNPASNYGGQYVETITLPGAVLYDLGSFPGLKFVDDPTKTVVCDVFEVDDHVVPQLDRYEGYRPDNPEHSLYLRRTLEDGSFIYEFNENWARVEIVESGDWLEYRR